MPYQIAGIDVHKKMLAVVMANVEVDGEYRFERLKVGTSPADLRALADWLVEREVEEVVMESTAQYWRPVWEALELHWRLRRRNRDGASPLSGTLHLAQAQSNRGAGGRKRDFLDAERLVKRLAAQELTRRDRLTCEQHASMLITCPRWSKSAMCRTRCTESSRAGRQTQDKRSPISSWPNLNVWPHDRRATRC